MSRVIHFETHATAPEALATNDRLGGLVALPETPGSGVGWLAHVKQTDGNIPCLLQPDPEES